MWKKFDFESAARQVLDWDKNLPREKTNTQSSESQKISLQSAAEKLKIQTLSVNIRWSVRSEANRNHKHIRALLEQFKNMPHSDKKVALWERIIRLRWIKRSTTWITEITSQNNDSKKVLAKKLVLSEFQKTWYSIPEKDLISWMTQEETVQWNLKNTLKRVPKLPWKIIAAIDGASKKYWVDKKIIIAKICTESGCWKFMTSWVWADWYMQVMPETLNEVITKIDPSLKKINDSQVQNIFAWTAYLSEMIGTFNWDLDIASAAYNTWPNKVKNALNKWRNHLIFNETKRHVFYMNLYKQALDINWLV